MQQAKLMLHTGAATVAREQLALVPLPAKTASYMPIPHHTLLEQVEGVLLQSGYNVVTQAHGLTRDGNRYFGLLQVANGHNSDEFGLTVGVRNSHDKTFPAALCLGTAVFVCDNLSFHGDVKLARKHTVHIERDLPGLVLKSIGRLVDLRGRQEKRFLTYQHSEITHCQANDLIIRAMDARVLPVTKISEVLEEWRNPRHPEFAQGGLTAWRLYNAFTEVAKGNLIDLPRRSQALHGLLDAELGLIFPPTVDVTGDAVIETVAPTTAV